MTVELREWDGARYIRTREDVLLCIEVCFAEDSDNFVLVNQTFRDIGRSIGLQQLAAETGIDGDELARGLSGDRLSFEAVHILLTALGLQFRVHPVAVDEPSVG